MMRKFFLSIKRINTPNFSKKIFQIRKSRSNLTAKICLLHLKYLSNPLWHNMILKSLILVENLFPKRELFLEIRDYLNIKEKRQQNTMKIFTKSFSETRWTSQYFSQKKPIRVLFQKYILTKK